jgi:vitamin K-dependent gamma-carboxylase-like protein
MTALARWWFAPAPPERLAVLRIAIGAYATLWTAARLPELMAVARSPVSQFAPVGVIRVLAAPLPPGAVLAIAVATIGLLAAFTAGVHHRLVAPLAAAAALWTLSYRSSWGMLFHTENLLALHLIALACAPAADAWALGRRSAQAERAAGHGWAIKLLAALTCATYLLAGIAKLRLAGLDWLAGDQLRNQIAVDNVRKALLGASTAPLAARLLAHPAALIALSLAALAIELGAPLALLGGRIARLWALAAWGFHAGVVLAMNVWFPYPLLGVAFLPLFAAERLVAAPLRWWRSRAISVT